MKSTRHRTVRFSVPNVAATSLDYVASALAQGHTAGDGPLSARVATALRPWVGPGTVVLTPSGTSALELALVAAGVGRGDEVIVPSFGFASDLTCVTSVGARPIFADVDPASLCLSPESVERLIGPRTRAVIGVHYGGTVCSQTLNRICESNDLLFLEDAAHSLGARVGRVPAGSIGGMAAFSFHQTKNLQCGEGGALVVNDDRYLETMFMAREFGTDRRRHSQGKVVRYECQMRGSSYLLSDILAGVLLAGLEDFERDQRRRRDHWKRYFFELGDWAEAADVQLPVIDVDVIHGAHIFHLLMPRPDVVQPFIRDLGASGIDARTHYTPLHDSPHGREASGGDCPVSESVSSRLVRLPLHASLSDGDVDHVVAAVSGFAVS